MLVYSAGRFSLKRKHIYRQNLPGHIFLLSSFLLSFPPPFLYFSFFLPGRRMTTPYFHKCSISTKDFFTLSHGRRVVPWFCGKIAERCETRWLKKQGRFFSFSFLFFSWLNISFFIYSLWHRKPVEADFAETNFFAAVF